MSETKHTPGPWEVFICDYGGQWTGWPLSINAKNDEDKTVVRTGGQWPYEWDMATSQREAVANAHLISAAPDLLAAAKSIFDKGYVSQHIEEERADHLALAAAIAKAEGRP